MSHPGHIAFMAAMPLPAADGVVPDWVHIAPPAGQPITTYDGRGPYRYADANKLIATSMARKPKMVIDENHSTMIATKAGGQSPARGYVEAMEERPDGIWAQIDWNPSGRALMADRAYWGVSPVFLHDDSGRIDHILNIALTNDPNLRGLAALHQETSMTFMDQIAEALGLQPGATEDDIMTAIRAAVKAPDDKAVEGGDIPAVLAAAQSALAQIGTALGVDGGNTAAVLAAAHARAAGSAMVTAL